MKFEIGAVIIEKFEYRTGELQLEPAMPKVTEKVPDDPAFTHCEAAPVTPGPDQA